MTYKNIAIMLCNELTNTPCGCDHCPLLTDECDKEGNAICLLKDTKEPDNVEFVIRCKDCVNAIKGAVHDKYECSQFKASVFGNNFCSYGRKKRAEGD